MISLKEAIKLTGASLSEIGELVGLSKSAVSRISSGDYPGWQSWQKKAIEEMVRQGRLTFEDSGLGGEETAEETKDVRYKVDPDKFIDTANVLEINDLCKDLLNPATTLNASIGMAVGSAGFGKTTAVQRFCSTCDRAVYTLYVEGFTLPMLMREIAKAMSGNCSRGFDQNLGLVRDAAAVYRKLLVVDEADRLPLKYLESLRTVNQYCRMPLLLIGERELLAKMRSLPRLESRIRKPLVTFQPLALIDVDLYYREAAGMELSDEVKDFLLKQSRGDFRLLANDAHHLVKILNANDIEKVTLEVCKSAFGK